MSSATHDYVHTFGSLLKRYRRELGITQNELASRAGYSEVYIGMLERGQRIPSDTTIDALAEALALQPHQRDKLIASAHEPGVPPHEYKQPSPYEPALIGRSREMALLLRHLERDSRTSLLTVSGEPGIGKTRLLQEIARHAASTGWTVLEGSSYAQSGSEPFRPLLDALEQYVQRQTPTLLRQRLEGCAWLTHLLPELVEREIAIMPPIRGLAPEQERRLMFRAVGRFLQNVAGEYGTLLVLDDVQWAGPDALDLLAHLLRAQPDLPFRAVLAVRSTEVHPEGPLAALLTELKRSGKATQLELDPLAKDEAKDLLECLMEQQAPTREHMVTHVLRRSGGIPLFLVSYAQALRSTTMPSWSTEETVPRDVVDGMRQRVAALPETARELLGMAAIVGTRAPRALLMDMMMRQGHPEGLVLAALEDTCRARLLVEEGYDAYKFSHDLVREAILASLSMARRAALHRSVADALERAPIQPSAQVLAYHYTRSGDIQRAITYLERAGDHALAMRANAEASHLYRELVVQLDTLDLAKEAAAAREKLGAALMTAAQYDAALDALEWAAEIYRADNDFEGQARVLARVGDVHALRGSSEDGIARLESWLAIVGETSPLPSAGSLAALYVSLSWLINTTGQYAEALRVAQRAVDLASVAGDMALLLQAKLRCGHLLLMLERVDQGVAILETAIPDAEALGDLRSLRFALNSLGWIHELRGNIDLDQAYTERAYAVAEQLEDPTVLAFMRSNRGSPAFNRGNWRQARADFEAGLALSRQIGSSWASAWPPLLLGQLCLAEGLHERAEALLKEACLLAEHNKDLEATRWAQGALAERDLLNGQPDRVVARLESLLDRPGQQEIDVCALLPILAHAYSNLGQVEQAEEMAEAAIARATATEMLPTLANALLAHAVIAQRQGHSEQALQRFEQALEVNQSIGNIYGAAKIYYACGVFWKERSNTEAAQRALTQARDILAQLGERLYGERVEETLRAIMIHVR